MSHRIAGIIAATVLVTLCAIPQPVAAGPSLEYDTQRLVEITWYWQGTWKGAVRELAPEDSRQYTVRFSQDGRVAVRADCNRGVGTYRRRGQDLSISIRALTRAACPPGSLERQFTVEPGRPHESARV